jgi:hypothetical protein
MYSDVRKSETCIACHKQAPQTETDYTLISAQFGWRLTRSYGEDGSIRLEWRCPTCWAEYKRANHAPGEAVRSSSNPPPQSTMRPTAGRGALREAGAIAPILPALGRRKGH